MLSSFVQKPHTRAAMVQEDAVIVPISLQDWRVNSDMTLLPTAGDSTSLGLGAGIAGTSCPNLIGSQAISESEIESARAILVLPECYVAGQSVTFRINGRYQGAGTKVEASIDLYAYLVDDSDGTEGSDICATAKQNLTTSWANYDFAITPTGFVVGSRLDLVIYSKTQESGGVFIKNKFNGTQLLLDIKG